MISSGFHSRCILLFFLCALCSKLHAQSTAVASASSETTTFPPDPLEGYRIVCLYNHKQYYRHEFKASQINPTLCTHINYEFAILDPVTYEMKSGDPDVDIDMKMYEETVNLRNQNPHLKVLLSLGGWQDSTKKYSDLVDSAIRIDNFIEKAIQFLKDYRFDGLDVAWEYPNCWKGDLGRSPKDKKNFAEFLEKLRKRFDKEGFVLSVSVGSIKREIDAAYDVPSISDSVHHINVMTYDMHGPWEHQTGHHTQMDVVEGDKDRFLNAIAAIKVWTDKGADKAKLNLGTASYAKTFTLADPAKHGLHAPSVGPGRPGYTTKQSGYLCYFEICQFLNAGNWTEDEHKAAGFYAYSGDQWACYDPPMMVVRKAEWVVENGLGGLLIKDVSCDDYKGKCFSLDFPLIRMMRMEILHKLSKMHRKDKG